MELYVLVEKKGNMINFSVCHKFAVFPGAVFLVRLLIDKHVHRL